MDAYFPVMRPGNFLKPCLLVLFVSAACSPARVTLTKAELSRLRSETKIPVVIHAPEPFSFVSAEDNFRTALAVGAVGALTGGLGGVLVGMHAESRARSQGEELARANTLEDPALKVRDGFLSALVNQFNMTNLVPLDETFATDDPKSMGEKLAAGIVLDFKTSDWRLIPAGSDAHYRVVYRVRSRFFRTSDQKVVWQGYCRYDPDGTHATLPELTARSGVLLRAKMDEAAEACAATLLVQFLGQD